jgi:hypothetical protein
MVTRQLVLKQGKYLSNTGTTGGDFGAAGMLLRQNRALLNLRRNVQGKPRSTTFVLTLTISPCALLVVCADGEASNPEQYCLFSGRD